MEKRKENAKADFLNMIYKSWTWERLTEEEREKFIERINQEIYNKIIKGNYWQRWETLQQLYSIYLAGLGYEPFGWREPEQDEENQKENKKLQLINNLEWLESHNKQYTKEQYYRIYESLEIIKDLEI